MLEDVRVQPSKIITPLPFTVVTVIFFVFFIVPVTVKVPAPPSVPAVNVLPEATVKVPVTVRVPLLAKMESSASFVTVIPEATVTVPLFVTVFIEEPISASKVNEPLEVIKIWVILVGILDTL